MANATPQLNHPTPTPDAVNDNRMGTVVAPAHAQIPENHKPTTWDRAGDSVTRAMNYPYTSPSPVPHTVTQSTLAPTSEYMRYLLAAWGARYVFRGFFGTLFDKSTEEAGHGMGALATKIMRWVEKPGDWIQKKYPASSPTSKIALTYNTALGVGSTTLTMSYTKMVYDDIINLFREEVGEELGKAPEQVTFNDIRHSNNRIVQQTMKNFWEKLGSRLIVDLAFFPAAWLRSDKMGDLVLGAKATQLFLDTWKRKPTMFEDLVTFVNHKINPANGLGQPITIGEVFDLYQHYAGSYQPEKVFRTVLSRDSSDAERMTISQPVFSRITQLMNLTYAYKHNQASEAEVAQANFALPKLIYMLGHDLIDPTNPQQTMALVEVMNAQGAAGVKHAQAMLAKGAAPQQVLDQFGLHFPQPGKTLETEGPNGVIHKGSTMQMDTAPSTSIHAPSASTSQLAALAAAQVQH